MYIPRPIAADNVEDLRRFLQEEFELISSAMRTGYLQLAESHTPPARPRDGMIVFADGVNWNPGGGRGVYAFSNGDWVKL